MLNSAQIKHTFHSLTNARNSFAVAWLITRLRLGSDQHGVFLQCVGAIDGTHIEIVVSHSAALINTTEKRVTQLLCSRLWTMHAM